MSSATVGALRADLSLETARFKKGLDAAKAHTENFVKEMREKALHLAEAFALFEVAEKLKGVFEGMEQIVLTSQKIGIPVEMLSRMQLAADVTHTSMETLAGGVAKFSKNLEAIAGGQGGNAALALKAIGVSATDVHGKLKPTDKLLLEVAEKFSKTADGANKTAVVMALFGKAGAELIPWLNKGSDGLSEFNAKADQLGLKISEETAVKIEEFSKDITILEDAFVGVVRQVITYFLPTMNSVTGSIADYLSTGGGAQKMTELLAQGLISIANAGLQVYSALGKAALLSVYAINSIAKGGATNQDYDSLIANLNTINKQVQWGTEKIKEYTVARHAMFDRDHQGESNGSSEPKNKKPQMRGFTELAAGHSKVKIATDRHAESVKEFIKQLQIQNEEFSKGALQMKIEEALRSHKVEALSVEGQKISWLIIKHAQLAAAQQTQAQEAQNLIDKQNKFTEAMTKAADYGSSTMLEWIKGTKSLNDSLGDLLNSLEKMALNAAFKQLLGSLFGGAGSDHPLYGGGGGGGFLSGLFQNFAGLFADGGTIPSGKFGVVGEGGGMQHAELVAGPATVIPMSQMNGGVKVNINNYASPDLSITTTQNNNNNTIEIAIEKKVNDTISSGKANQSMSSGFGLRPMRVRR